MLTCLFNLLMAILISAFSQQYHIVNGEVKISARSSIIGIEDEFDAIGKGMTGVIDLDKKTFELSYDMWNLDTGIELRNEHMHWAVRSRTRRLAAFLGALAS